MDLNPDNTKLTVIYKDGRGDIIDLEDKGGRILFKGNNIKWVNLNSAETRVIILYEDGRGEIIDRENGGKKILFKGNNVEWIRLNPAETRAIVIHENERGEIIDLEDYNRDIVFTKLKPEQLLFVFSLKNLNSPAVADSLIPDHFLWKSFSFNLKQKLQKSYFQQKVKEQKKLDKFY